MCYALVLHIAFSQPSSKTLSYRPASVHCLRPYRKNDRNMYVVRKAEGCTVKYVEYISSPGGNYLVLRPHNPDYPVEVLAIEEGQTYAELIVGRVAHVAAEI